MRSVTKLASIWKMQHFRVIFHLHQLKLLAIACIRLQKSNFMATLYSSNVLRFGWLLNTNFNSKKLLIQVKKSKESIRRSKGTTNWKMKLEFRMWGSLSNYHIFWVFLLLGEGKKKKKNSRISPFQFGLNRERNKIKPEISRWQTDSTQLARRVLKAT